MPNGGSESSVLCLTQATLRRGGGPVASAGWVFLPFLADGGGMAVALVFEAGFAEEVFGSVADGYLGLRGLDAPCFTKVSV